MKQSKITFLTGIGSGLEHYDYVLCSMFAAFISQNFFPNQDRVTTLFTTFTVLAISNMIRPFGAVIFGIFGDLLGRKNVFASTLLWMALITFLIGLIPNFATIGITATVLFSILRIIQGSIFGAEVPGAVTLLAEHIDDKRHGLHFGFMSAIIGIGILFGSFITSIITKILTETQMQNWGFRIPFLLGGGLAVVGFFIRKHLPETPKFLNLQNSEIKITLKVIKEHIGQVINVIGVLLFPAALIIFQLVFPVYLHDFYHFSFADIYSAMTCGYIMSTFLVPFFGWISDMIGRKILIVVAAITMIIGIFPILHLLQTEVCWAVFAFYLFTQTLASLLTASYFILLPLAFKTVIRFTGTALSYNITFAITALLPLIINYIYGIMKNPSYLAWIFILLATISAISTIILKIKRDDIDYQSTSLSLEINP